MSSRILLFGIVFLITAGSAYAFSITDIFQPILHALGIYSGEAPVIDSFSVVSQPSGPGEPFTVRLCVVTAPFSPSPSEARFAIDSMDNVVATRSFSPDPSQSITCREYSLTAPATPGNHTVYASVSDASGNWSDWKSAVFYVPGTAHDPKIDQILAPSSVGAGDPFSVQISVSDADGDLSSIYVKIGTFSKYIPVSGYDATETIRIPGMTVGTYTLSVTVYDRAGHSDDAERTIRVTLPPNSPPHIDSVSIPSHVYSEQSFTVTVRASDPDGDLRLIGISIPSINYSESREVDGTDESASFSIPGLPAGTYTLVAFAQDSVNHRVTKSLQFIVSPEYTGPSVSVSVSSKDVNVGDHVHISARADGENLSKIVVTVNGRSVSVSPSSCRGGEYCAVSADYVPESAGDYRVVATVYDGYGHSASDSTTFTAHAKNSSQCTCSPHVSLSVSPTSVDAGDSVLVTVNGYVDHSAGCGSEPLAIKLRVYVDGHVVRTFDCGAPYGPSCTKGPFTFNYTFNSPGDHVVRAQMVWDDCNGATRDDAWSSPVTVSVDTIHLVPCVTISASKSIVRPGEPVTFTATAHCANEIRSLDIFVDGVLKKTQNCYMSSSCTVSYTTSFQSGTHEAYAVMRYVVNGSTYSKRSNTVTVRVQKVSYPPYIASVTCSPSCRVVRGTLLSVTVRAGDPDGDLSTAVVAITPKDEPSNTFAWQSKSISSGTATFHFDVNYPPGDYVIHVTVTDRAGHEVTASKDLVVLARKNEPPVVYKLEGASVAYINRPYVVTVCARDPDGLVSIIEAWLDNGPRVKVVTAGSNVCKTISLYDPLTPGKHVVHARAMDDEGAWSAVASKTFTAIIPGFLPPTIVKYVVPTQVYVGKEFNISVTARDPDGDLADAYLVIRNSSGSVVVSERKPMSGILSTAVFTVSVPTSGEYNAIVVVWDTHFHRTSAWRTFTAIPQSNEPPVVDSVRIMNTVYAGEPFDVNVCAHDPDGVVEAVQAAVVPGGAVVSHHMGYNGCAVLHFSTPGKDVSPGKYVLSVVAVDNRGAKSAPYVVPLVVKKPEANAPSVTLLADYNPADRVIQWQARAEDPNLRDLNVYINGALVRSCVASSAILECNGEWNVPKPGDYVVQAVAEDRFGNVARKFVSIAVPDEPPSVSMVVPAEVPVARPVALTVVASDDWNLARVLVKGYGIDFNEAVDGRQFTKQFEVVFPREGNYWYSVVAVDSAGHIVERNVLVSATTAGHKYSLELTPESGSPARVLIAGYVDGSEVNLPCTDVVVNVLRTADSTGIAQYSLSTIVSGGYQICAVVISGPGEYLVTAQWNGVEKSVSVTAYRGVASAPENPVVAVVVALVVLAGLSRII